MNIKTAELEESSGVEALEFSTSQEIKLPNIILTYAFGRNGFF